MDNKYYLAIITKPNNYFPINLLDLKIKPDNISLKLEQLDNFTLKYTEKEIKEAIKEANLLDIDDNMPLVVIYYEKNLIRDIPALTKDISFNMGEYIQNNFNNKNIRNQIYTFLSNKTKEDLTKIKTASSLEEVINIIKSLPYYIQRKLYFYLYEKQFK